MIPPTPEHLRDLAEWFDNPNASPSVATVVCGTCSAGYLLRKIAEAFDVAMRKERGDG